LTVQPEDRITYPAVAVGVSRRLSEPESWTLVERICVSGPGPAYRFVDNGLGNDGQLLVLVLAQGAQPVQGFGFGSAAPAHHDADGALDDATAAQGGLQLAGQSFGLGKNLGVLYCDGRRHGEKFPETPSICWKRVLLMSINIHRAQHAGIGQ